MMRKNLLVVAVLTCVASACDTPTPVDTVSAGGGGGKHPVFASYADDTTWSWVQNSANPYNTFGVIHNRSLDYVDDHTSLTCGPDSNEWRLAMRDYLEADGVFCGAEAHDSLVIWEKVLEPYFHADSLPTLYAAAYGGQGLSTPERAVLDSIIHVVQNEPTLTSMLGGLNAIESNIITSTVLTSEQKHLPLFTVAIAKFSAAYWWPVAYGYGGYGDGFGKQDATAQTQSAFNQIVEADAVGGITGAVAGFFSAGTIGMFVGLCGGGAGAIAGFAQGAMYGSAGGGISGCIAASMKKGIELNKKKSVPYGGNQKKP